MIVISQLYRWMLIRWHISRIRGILLIIQEELETGELRIKRRSLSHEVPGGEIVCQLKSKAMSLEYESHGSGSPKTHSVLVKYLEIPKADIGFSFWNRELMSIGINKTLWSKDYFAAKKLAPQCLTVLRLLEELIE